MNLLNNITGRQISTVDASSASSNNIDVSNYGAGDYLVILQAPSDVSGDLPLSFSPGGSLGQIIHFINATAASVYVITRTSILHASWTGNPGDIISLMWTGTSWTQLYKAGDTTGQWVDFTIASGAPVISSTIQGLSVQDVFVLTRGTVTMGSPGSGVWPTVQAPVGLRGDFIFTVPASNAGNPTTATASMGHVDGIVTISGVPWVGGTFDLSVNYNIVD